MPRPPRDNAGIQRLSARGVASADGIGPEADDSGTYGSPADDNFLDYLRNGIGVVSDVQSIFRPPQNSQPRPVAQEQPAAFGGVNKTVLLYAAGAVVLLVVLLFAFKRK